MHKQSESSESKESNSPSAEFNITLTSNSTSSGHASTITIYGSNGPSISGTPEITLDQQSQKIPSGYLQMLRDNFKKDTGKDLLTSPPEVQSHTRKALELTPEQMQILQSSSSGDQQEVIPQVENDEKVSKTQRTHVIRTKKDEIDFEHDRSAPIEAARATSDTFGAKEIIGAVILVGGVVVFLVAALYKLCTKTINDKESLTSL